MHGARENYSEHDQPGQTDMWVPSRNWHAQSLYPGSLEKLLPKNSVEKLVSSLQRGSLLFLLLLLFLVVFLLLLLFLLAACITTGVTLLVHLLSDLPRELLEIFCLFLQVIEFRIILCHVGSQSLQLCLKLACVLLADLIFKICQLLLDLVTQRLRVVLCLHSLLLLVVSLSHFLGL